MSNRVRFVLASLASLTGAWLWGSPAAAASPPPEDVAPAPASESGSGGAHVHDGLYLRVAAGGGGFDADESTKLGSGLTYSGGGVGFDAALGGTFAPGWVLGGTLMYQRDSNLSVGTPAEAATSSGLDLNFGVVGPFVEWYPDPRGGFHLGALAGFAMATWSGSSSGASGTAGRGGAFGFGVGYDFWVASQWSIGVNGRFFASALNGTAPSYVDETYVVTGGTLSVAAVFH